jgi:EAL domain-containing protein (putative c-di-GMP-specific phosphodiesterase class I)/GGDEF domain-containing protein
VHYIVEYELCALLFLIAVAVRFFSMRNFPSKLNHIFGVVLIFAIADLILDIASSFVIEYASQIPPVIVYIVNTIFYTMQVGFFLLLMAYILIMCNYKRSPRSWHRVFLLIPAAICEGLLLSNPFTALIFYLQNTADGAVYARGPLFNLLYISGAVYLAAGIVLVLVKQKNLRKIERNSILAFILIIAATMLLQGVFPEYLLTGVAITLAILLIFFTLQNPESLLDSVSGVFNNTALNEYLLLQTGDKKPLWLTAVDVGGIRRINNTLSLRAGNELLAQVGLFLNNVCGEQSMAFRMIGTRFMIVSHTAKAHQAVVECVSGRFHEPWNYGGLAISLLATIRHNEEPEVFLSAEDVIGYIDLAYSHSAGEDFGTTRAIDTRLLNQSRRKVLVEEAVRRGLAHKESFSLRFQPLYDVSQKVFHSAEVLLRLYDAELGELSPSEFIPVAEATGLIHEIDMMVLDRTCRFLRAHPELEKDSLSLLEVNLSAAEFYSSSDRLSADILQQLNSIGNQICFEITETAVTSHQEILSHFMDTLGRHGVRFALDDFGTGYANIAQLSNLPFSIVKLDRAFVQTTAEKERIIMADLVKMFDHIGLSTVVEGVETAEQARLAAQMGATEIQGFYYSHPLREDEFVHLLTNDSPLSETAI